MSLLSALDLFATGEHDADGGNGSPSSSCQQWNYV